MLTRQVRAALQHLVRDVQRAYWRWGTVQRPEEESGELLLDTYLRLSVQVSPVRRVV